MRKIRNIPFGYRYENGVAVIDEQEGAVVLDIASLYLSGNSYQTIANEMMRRKILYHPEKPQWNRSMIKRILQNKRYLGTDLLPRLLSDADFKTIDELIHSKTAQYTVSPKFPRAVRSMVYCNKCGSPMKLRQNRKKRTWLCTNPDCSQRMSASLLQQQVSDLMNTLIAHPLQIQIPAKSEWVDSNVHKRICNQIRRESEKPDYDEETIRTLICNCAVESYETADDGSQIHLASSLRTLYGNATVQDEINLSLLTESIEKILIQDTEAITVRLLSGQELSSAGKEKENA